MLQCTGHLNPRDHCGSSGRSKTSLFFFGTPFLVFPAILFIQFAGVTSDDISLYVAALGSLGHHLPGMIRAYGDRALFQRFRLRFTLAPLFLAVCCLASTHYDLTVLSLVAITWGVWHGLMQTYGFIRIYDAKTSSYSARTSRLDLGMCVAWFGAGIFLSPNNLFKWLGKYNVDCAGYLPAAFTVARMETFWAWLTGIITTLFIANLIWNWLNRRRPNLAKMLLMGTSFGFWWYTRTITSDPLVGVALFEVFHDVQYLSIVWIFSLGRVEKDPTVGGFTRFIFRRSGALVGVYVGLVMAYGVLGLFAKGYRPDDIAHAFQGLLIGSGLLHFYYDGFIWKIREKSTRQSLGLAGGAESTASRLALAPGIRHSAKWALFVLPVVAIAFSERAERSKKPDRFQRIAAQMPHSSLAEYYLGEGAYQAGKLGEAIDHLNRSLSLHPRNREGHNLLGIVFVQSGDIDGGIHHYREALRISPKYAMAHTNLADELMEKGLRDEAKYHYDVAVEYDRQLEAAKRNRQFLINTEKAEEHNRLAVALIGKGQMDAAIRQLVAALQLNPNSAEAHNNIANILFDAGKMEEAL